MNQPKKEEQLDLEIDQQEEAQDVEIPVRQAENAETTVVQEDEPVKTSLKKLKKN